MGKYNLQTSKKRVSNKADEAEAVVELPDDEVSTSLQRFSDHLNAHIGRYAVAIVVALIVGGLTSWWLNSRHKKSAENTQKLFDAVEVSLGSARTYAPTEASVAPPEEGKKPAEPKFETEDAKWTATADTLGKVKGDLTGPRVALASAIEGRVLLGQKKPADAVKAFGEFATQAPDSTLLPLVLESQGSAAWAAGDVAGAEAAFGKLVAMSDLYYKTRGNMLLGDLYNPIMGGTAAKDAAKAKGFYDAALKGLEPAEGQVFAPPLRSLRGEVARRKAQL